MQRTNRHIPKVVKGFVAPLLILIIAFPLTA